MRNGIWGFVNDVWVVQVLQDVISGCLQPFVPLYSDGGHVSSVHFSAL